jgi:DNA-binding IclR family transcriptional regulator
MNGETFRRYTTTLRDAGLMEYDSKTKSYYLTPEGWK